MIWISPCEPIQQSATYAARRSSHHTFAMTARQVQAKDMEVCCGLDPLCRSCSNGKSAQYWIIITFRMQSHIYLHIYIHNISYCIVLCCLMCCSFVLLSGQNMQMPTVGTQIEFLLHELTPDVRFGLWMCQLAPAPEVGTWEAWRRDPKSEVSCCFPVSDHHFLGKQNDGQVWDAEDTRIPCVQMFQ